VSRSTRTANHVHKHRLQNARYVISGEYLNELMALIYLVCQLELNLIIFFCIQFNLKLYITIEVVHVSTNI
jgi:hypothetical protein